MDLQKVRSYRKNVIERLEQMAKRNVNLSLEFMGFVDQEHVPYRLVCVSVGGSNTTNPKDVLISAGIHGEEPAGVLALLGWLDEMAREFTDSYRFLVFPCINPFGYEHGHRFNPDGVDINRNFKAGSDCHEAAQVMRVLSRLNRRFVCAIDLHETDPNWSDEGFTPKDNPEQFYMWENCPDRRVRIGDKVVERVEEFLPVCSWDKIYGDKNSGGVIWYPEGSGNPIYAQGTTLDGYVASKYSSQTFTLETPCGWGLGDRIFCHLVAIRSILNLKRSA